MLSVLNEIAKKIIIPLLFDTNFPIIYLVTGGGCGVL